MWWLYGFEFWVEKEIKEDFGFEDEFRIRLLIEGDFFLEIGFYVIGIDSGFFLLILFVRIFMILIR